MLVAHFYAQRGDEAAAGAAARAAGTARTLSRGAAVSSAALALQEAMRAALMAHAPLRRCWAAPMSMTRCRAVAGRPIVAFDSLETRDWSTVGPAGA